MAFLLRDDLRTVYKKADKHSDPLKLEWPFIREETLKTIAQLKRKYGFKSITQKKVGKCTFGFFDCINDYAERFFDYGKEHLFPKPSTLMYLQSHIGLEIHFITGLLVKSLYEKYIFDNSEKATLKKALTDNEEELKTIDENFKKQFPESLESMFYSFEHGQSLQADKLDIDAKQSKNFIFSLVNAKRFGLALDSNNYIYLQFKHLLLNLVDQDAHKHQVYSDDFREKAALIKADVKKFNFDQEPQDIFSLPATVSKTTLITHPFFMLYWLYEKSGDDTLIERKELDTLERIYFEEQNSIALVRGLWGVGKSTLAKLFFFKHWKNYQLAYVFDASNTGNLAKSFNELAIQLNLKQSDENITITIQKLKRWLTENPKAFLLFKDTTNETIKEVLAFIDFVGQTTSHTNLMITSSEKLSIKGFELPKVKLGKFSAKESEALISNYLKIPLDDLVKSFAKECGYFPIVCGNALAYMKDDFLMTLDEFLEEFRSNPTNELFLASEYAEAQHKNVLKLFEMTKEKLQPGPLQLLQLLSFFPSENIGLSLFLNHNNIFMNNGFYTEKKQVNQFLLALIKYSLVERETTNNTLSMNSFLQKITRTKLKEDIGFWERLYCTLNELISVVMNTDTKEWRDRANEIQCILEIAKNLEETFGKNFSTETYTDLGLLCKEIGLFDRALDYYRKIEQNLLVKYNKDNYNRPLLELLYKNYNNQACIYYEQGRYQEALDKMKLTEKYYNECCQDSTNDHLGFLLANMGSCSRELGQFDRAGEYLLKASKILNKSDDKINVYREFGILFKSYIHYQKMFERVAEVLNIKTDTLDLTLLYDTAYQCYQQALKNLEEIEEKDPCVKARLLNNLGTLCIEWKAIHKALEYYHAGLYELHESCSHDKSLRALFFYNIAEAHYKEKNMEEALSYLEKSDEILKEQLYDTQTPYNLLLKSQIYLQQGKLIESSKFYKQASTMKFQTFNGHLLESVDFLLYMVDFETKIQEDLEAQNAYTKAHKILKNIPAYASCLENLCREQFLNENVPSEMV